MPICYENRQNLLKGLFNRAQNELILISAFCSSQAIRLLLAQVSTRVRITLITRWNKDDILNGSSDLEVFGVISEKAGNMYRNPRLHAKLYMIDKQYLIFGSANITARGLGLGNCISNIECVSTAIPVQPADVAFVNEIIRDAQIVDEAVLQELQAQLINKDIEDWNEDELDRIATRSQGIFVGDFPFCDSPEQLLEDQSNPEACHDLIMLGLERSGITIEEIMQGLKNSRIMCWLDRQFETAINFGELSARIHNQLLDDPKPYRKEIKALQGNLFGWIDTLLGDTYRIEVPSRRHSQVIRRL